MVVAIYREPRHLNPALRIGTWGYRIAMHNIYEPLVRRNPKTLSLEPWLASHWTVGPDGKTYTFELRRGVRWHDGRPLTAQDVWFSLTRVQARNAALGPFKEDVQSSLQRVDMPGPWTVRVTLRVPNGFFLDALSEYPILPYHLFARNLAPGSLPSRKPVGTGPFRFARWKRGTAIELTRNAAYWGPVPDAERLRFVILEDRARALTGLKRGDIDVLPDLIREHFPSQITEGVRRAFRLVLFPAPGFSYILWNTKSPILADFRVRRALTMLIDRPRLVREVHHDLARVVAGPFWRPAGLGDPKLKPWPYDPVEARNLLDMAGWRDRDGDKVRDKDGHPLRIVLLAPVRAPLLQDELKIVSAEFKKSGVDLVYVPTDWPMMLRMLRRGRFLAAALHWTGRPAEDLSPLFHSTGRHNYGRIANLALDQLLSRLRLSRNPARRAEYSAKIERILHAYEPITILHAPVQAALVSRRLENVHLGCNWFEFGRMKVKGPRRHP